MFLQISSLLLLKISFNHINLFLFQLLAILFSYFLIFRKEIFRKEGPFVELVTKFKKLHKDGKYEEVVKEWHSSCVKFPWLTSNRYLANLVLQCMRNDSEEAFQFYQSYVKNEREETDSKELSRIARLHATMIGLFVNHFHDCERAYLIFLEVDSNSSLHDPEFSYVASSFIEIFLSQEDMNYQVRAISHFQSVKMRNLVSTPAFLKVVKFYLNNPSFLEVRFFL